MSVLAAQLAELAEEHLARMSRAGWSSHAAAIAKRAPLSAGETFGCEIDGRYFDVGDRAEWADEEGGNIRLTAFATSSTDNEPQTVSRVIVIVANN